MMQGIKPSQYDYGLLRQVLFLQAAFWLILTAARFLLFTQFTPHYDDFPLGDFLQAMFMGGRIDLVLIAYLSILPFLLIAFNALLWHVLPLRLLQWMLGIYFVAIYLLVLFLVGADFAFYSYFGEHINILVFGVFDDDTQALLGVARKNYNLPLLAILAMVVIAAIVFLVWRMLHRIRPMASPLRWWGHALAYPAMVVLIFFAARGSLGTFPLIKDVPEVSADRFINSLPMNGVLAAQKAWEQYAASKADRFDLAASVGYKDAYARAVADFVGREVGERSDLYPLLLRKSHGRKTADMPSVVMVMVESLGMPILEYQSDRFDIMGRLQRHFQEDYVFRNFISGGNGTIASLEPLLLNILPRPNSIPLSQSSYQRVRFPFAAAKPFQEAGYETRFVYGGDLSWRNVGEFLRLQGFQHVEGKAAIIEAVPDTRLHDWGVFDQYAYQYVLQLLQQPGPPRFIFLLTTNNHPPYTIPDDYQARPLEMPEALKKNLTGNSDLFEGRIQDYQYAVDMSGAFMDRIKASSLADRTVVVITGDNNTIEGVMRYANPLQEAKRVPFYLYLPPSLRPTGFRADTPGSHKDIFPTLYNLILADQAYLSLGRDLFDPAMRHCGFNDAGVIIAEDGAFELGKADSEIQQQCEKEYRSGLATTAYLLQWARSAEKQRLASVSEKAIGTGP